MTEKSVLAVDLGAESGRVMRIGFDGRAFSLEEIHRFRNLPIETPEALQWNAVQLWHDVQIGIGKALHDHQIDSIGVCTWGVDFALLDRAGNLIDNPYHYRDQRSVPMMDWVYDRVPARTVYERTGIQLMSINTLFQLASLKAANSPDLELAETLLTIPSLFYYWLCGVKVAEFTHTTTTQMFNPRLNTWDTQTLNTLDIPHHFLPEIVMPGTRLGSYRGIPVIAIASHDTASAVAAVPTKTDNFAYLSSGTWSLLGLEMREPVINDAAFAAGVTNEGGVGGTYCLMQNLMGLWLAQQSRKTWAEAGTNLSYEELTTLAESAAPFRSLFDANDPRFLPPGDMPARIRAYCRETGQPEPETIDQVARSIFESLAFKYREVLDKLGKLTGREIDHLHIVGGGSRNPFLNQLTANVLDRPVYAGPVEGTALGNALVQFIELGEIGNIHEGRLVLSATTSPKLFVPQRHADSEAQYERLQQLQPR